MCKSQSLVGLIFPDRAVVFHVPTMEKISIFIAGDSLPWVCVSGCAASRELRFGLTGGKGVLYLQNFLIPISPADFRYRKQKESAQGKSTELRLRSRLSPSPRKSQGRPDFRNGFFLEHSDSSPVQEELEKPSGKRKCKTKHLAGICDEGKVRLGLTKGMWVGRNESDSHHVSKPGRRVPRLFCFVFQVKGRWSQPKTHSPKKPQDSWPLCKSHRVSPGSSPELPAAQHIPPEARRLIVNKNAGETLLQRAARLGYKVSLGAAACITSCAALLWSVCDQGSNALVSVGRGALLPAEKEQ